MADIVTTWTLDTSQLAGGLKESGQQIDDAAKKGTTAGDKLDGSFKKTGDSAKTAGIKGAAGMKTLIAGVAGVTAATGAAVAAIGAMVKKAIEFADATNQIAKRAKEAGTSAEEYQTLQGALDMMTRGGLEASIVVQNLRDNIEAARDGTVAAVDAFGKLGINFETLAQQSPTEQLATIADALQGVEDPATRASVQIDLFSRAGKRIGPALQSGGDAVRAAASEIRNAGVISNEAAAHAEEMADQVQLLKQAFLALKSKAIDPLLPALTSVINLVNSFLSTSNGSAKALAKLNERLGETSGEMADAIPVTDTLSTAIQTATGKTTGMSDAVKKLGEQVSQTFGILSHDAMIQAIEDAGDLSSSFDVLYTQALRTTDPIRFAAEEASASFARMESDIVGSMMAAGRSAEEWGNLLALTGAASVREVEEAVKLYASVIVDQYRTAWAASTTAVEDAAAVETEAVKTVTAETGDALGERRDMFQEYYDSVGLAAQEANRRQRSRDAELHGAQIDGAIELGEQWTELTSETLSTLTDAFGSYYDHLADLAQESTEYRMKLEDKLSETMSDESRKRLKEEIKAARKRESEAKRAAKESWAVTQAMAIATVAAQGAMAAISGLAAGLQIGGPAGIALGIATMGLAIGATAVSIADIASQDPQFHRGGMVEDAPGAQRAMLSDEVQATVLRQEAVLSRQGVTTAGGPDGVDALNRGEGAAGAITVISKVNNRTTNVAVHEVLRSRRGSLWAAIRETQPRVGNHRPSFARG